MVQLSRPQGLELIFPIGRQGIFIGVAFIAWAAFVIVGSSNGVNLTDGLDGLAGGCLIFAGSAFAVLTYLSGHRTMAEYLDMPHMVGAGELSVLFAAMVGAMLGFLWYNCHPAQVFNGRHRVTTHWSIAGLRITGDSSGNAAGYYWRCVRHRDTQRHCTGHRLSADWQASSVVQSAAQSLRFSR